MLRPEDIARVRFKGDGNGGNAALAGNRKGSLQNSLMAAMHAVEIADGDGTPSKGRRNGLTIDELERRHGL